MDEVKMKQPAGEKPVTDQQQGIQNLVPTQAQTKSGPNLAKRYLLEGSREEYLRIGVPLYEASIKCNWKEAEKILTNKDSIELELVRCSITENGETALHVAASAKVPRKVEKFVKNLMKLMTKEDLELENANYNTALFLAASAGNIETVKIMMKKNDKLLSIPGGGSQYSKPEMMPIYNAVLFGHHDLARYMYEKSNDLTEGGWTDKSRGWLLEKCVDNNMFDIALRILELHKSLASKSNASLLRELARKPSAFSKAKSGIVKRTYSSVSAFNCLRARTHEKESDALPLLRFIWKDIVKLPKSELDDILRGPPDSIKSPGSGRVVQTILQQLIFDHLDKLDKEAHKLTEGTEDALQLKNFLTKHVVNLHAETQSLVNQYNIPDEDQTREMHGLISEYVVNILDATQGLFERKAGKDYQARELCRLIINHTYQMRHKTQTSKRYSKTYSSRVMFIAAEVGNTTFLLELIRRSPDLIWNVNDNGLSIFHVAVKHRHEGIYNLLYEIGSMKDMVTPLKDKDGNNMLHFAAMSTMKKNLEGVSGAALQMQRELLWFMEVEHMIPPSYRERLNKDGLTPRELFTKEHQDLITQGEKWMKATASQCMVVATLIATIVFAAAFTVPGGYGQNDGIPMFSRKLSFVAFVVADAISLFLSSASILTFLSILTSRYAERDFVRSLPMKLMAGLATLFLSIGTMMVTFSVSFFVLYHKEMKWIPIFISLFAVTPAILYVALQYHLLIDVFRSTYGGKYLFEPTNKALFYENPKY